MKTGSEEFGTVDSHADTVRIRILPQACEQHSACTDSPQRGFDPYSTDVGALGERARPRRTLDDMRRLSEAIVRNRLRAK
jgi:hypothetical protein